MCFRIYRVAETRRARVPPSAPPTSPRLLLDFTAKNATSQRPLTPTPRLLFAFAGRMHLWARVWRRQQTEERATGCGPPAEPGVGVHVGLSSVLTRVWSPPSFSSPTPVELSPLCFITKKERCADVRNNYSMNCAVKVTCRSFPLLFWCGHLRAGALLACFHEMSHALVASRSLRSSAGDDADSKRRARVSRVRRGWACAGLECSSTFFFQ